MSATPATASSRSKITVTSSLWTLSEADQPASIKKSGP